MNRSLTALFSALEALLVAAIGIGIPLSALTVLWAFQYNLQVDWIVFWRAAADTWLLGNGVDVAITLDPTLAATLNLPGAGARFVLTMAPLGFALLTVLLGARAGRRIGETPHRQIGTVTSVVVFAALSLAITLSSLPPAARPSIVQGTLLPTLVFAIGIGIGAELGRRSRGPLPDGSPGSSVRDWVGDWRPGIRAAGAAALRGGAASAAIVTGVAALLLGVLLLANYARIITLYESAHSGVLGGIALTVGQLALLPNMVIWTASWLVGPGFAIGTGSSVGPVGTSLGPLPGVPLLGALPEGDLAFGFIGILVPVLAGFVAALAVRPRLVRQLGNSRTLPAMFGTGLLIGVAGGVLIGLLAWFSAGSAGPGRLVDVGPSPWLVGAYAALEIGIAAAVGLLAGRPRDRTGDRASDQTSDRTFARSESR
ncbi:MAG: hypothetical protein JWO10_827 [Microbacteriaceae bacterium]|nr:hypothetical protein [Microbacteriaceae bacterium]